MKSLSVIIPAYNVGKYIKRCLDSLTYDKDALKYLDVIVVDDGSSDMTFKIAERYAKKYINSVKVIKKVNGGHGSTINEGIKVSKGRYIKILDGDDWFNVFELGIFAKRLSEEKADVVITNYKRILLYNEKEKEFNFFNKKEKGIYKICDVTKELDCPEFFFKFSMPSMTVRTEVLKKTWGEGLPEKRFYVDQLFVAKVLLCADTYTVYNMDIYRHFIGRSEQSIGMAGLYKHRLDHEFVLKELLKIYIKTDNEYKKQILKKQLILMLQTQYQIYLYDDSFLKTDRRELIKFNNFLKKNYEEFYKEKITKINILRRIR